MLATTRGALLRGATEDALGDEVDNNTTPLIAYSEWQERRRNLFTNPRAVTLDGFLPSHGSVATSLIDDFPGEIPTAVRNVRTAAGATRWADLRVGAEMPASGAPVCVILRTRASEPIGGLVVSARPNVGQNTNASTLASGVTIPAGESVLAFAGPSFPVPTTQTSSGIAITGNGGAVGAVLDYTAITIEAGLGPAVYLDGDTAALGDLLRTRWLGEPGRSVSVLEERELLGDWSDFPLSLIERETREQDPASNTWRTVRYFAGRVPADVPVDEGDRIRDNRDGKIYAVDSIRREPRSLSGRSSVSLKLRRTAP